MIYKLKPNRVLRTYLGGSRIDALRGTIAEDGFFPEEWVASVTAAQNVPCADVIPPGISVIDGGKDDGRPLTDLLREHPEYLKNKCHIAQKSRNNGDFEILDNPKNDKSGEKNADFPILLKLLDSAERLVVQAHPTVEFAKKNFGSHYGKAECWYVLSADEDAYVYLGFKKGITREEWKRCFEDQDIEAMLSLLHKIPVKPGDVWYVDGGVPHAIGGGCLLAELQEPTDLMVVPEKRTPSGREIPEKRLHGGLGFEKMFDCFEYDGYTIDELRSRYYRHISNDSSDCTTVIGSDLTDKFVMYDCRTANAALELCPEQTRSKPSAAVVISGTGNITDNERNLTRLSPGDALFIPNGERVKMDGTLRILIAFPGNSSSK